MIILGIDPSLTNYGWAIHDSEATGNKRCVARGRFKTDPGMIEVDRYTYLRSELTELIKTYNPEAVGLESPVFHSTYSEGMYALYMFTQEALKSSCINTVVFSPMQIKSLARTIVGLPKKTKMGKPQMCQAARKDTSTNRRTKWDHNEADAYLMAVFGARYWEFFTEKISEEDLNREENNIFCKAHTYKRGKHAGETEYRGIIYKENKRFFLWSDRK